MKTEELIIVRRSLPSDTHPEQELGINARYTVLKLINRLTPMVGTVVTGSELTALLDNTRRDKLTLQVLAQGGVA